MMPEEPQSLTVQISDAKALRDAARRVQKYKQRFLVMSGASPVGALVPLETLEQLGGASER